MIVTNGRRTASRAGPLVVLAVAVAALPGCTSTASTPGTASTSPVPAASAAPARSAPAAARADRMRAAAAAGRSITYLEYLCSVPAEQDPALVFVAFHERTTWRSADGAASLDAVLAQPVKRSASGSWAASGEEVPIRSVRNGRLASDAIIGLVGPDHRCSAKYIGPPVSG